MKSKKLSNYLSKTQDLCNNLDRQKTTQIIISDSKGNYLERESKRLSANILKTNVMWITKQVAQWATIANLRASIMFGDTIIDDAERQVILNLKQ